MALLYRGRGVPFCRGNFKGDFFWIFSNLNLSATRQTRRWSFRSCKLIPGLVREQRSTRVLVILELFFCQGALQRILSGWTSFPANWSLVLACLIDFRRTPSSLFEKQSQIWSTSLWETLLGPTSISMGSRTDQKCWTNFSNLPMRCHQF